jgi:hypothetical protein
MKTSLAILVVALAAALPGGSVWAKPKPPVPCKVYFTSIEKDSITRGTDLEWLNKPQAKWYEKHGDRGEFAGICFLPSDKWDALPVGVPVYVIRWGQILVTAPRRGTTYRANALIAVFNLQKKKFVPVDTASSTSDDFSFGSVTVRLLKHSLARIATREKARLAE